MKYLYIWAKTNDSDLAVAVSLLRYPTSEEAHKIIKDYFNLSGSLDTICICSVTEWNKEQFDAWFAGE